MEGIIFKIADYKETSKILTILTPNGIETVIARGCKKMNSSLLFLCQTYNRISYVRSEKSMYSLIEGSIIDSNESIKLNFKKNQALSLIFKHINLVNEYNETFYMFMLKVIEALKFIDEKSLYMMFKVKMLYFLGINPQFQCGCGNKDSLINFDVHNGLAICNKCTLVNRVNLVKIIYNLYYDKKFSVILDKKEYDEIFDFITEYYYIHLNVKIKGEEFL